jgi:DNA-binding beta-propeller fold protein YncE
VTVVLEGLYNPCGVAIQPETGAIFVADSGALRVIRVGADGKPVDVITGFTKDIYGKGPMYDIGPLGLCFLSKDVLVVGDGGKPDGEELLRIYRLPEDGKPLAADQHVAAFNLPKTDEVLGEGNFYGLAVTNNAIYVTCNGDDTKGWIARCAIRSDGYGPFERAIATKEAVQVDAPVAITVDSRGNLVVGQMGEINVPNDSLLSFYDPKTGKLLVNYKTGLHDITALAYHPKTGRLYATDFAWLDVSQGGLFELVSERKDGQVSAVARKILPLMKPTAMAFDADGNLYVTVMGDAKEGAGPKVGQLLKISW